MLHWISPWIILKLNFIDDFSVAVCGPSFIKNGSSCVRCPCGTEWTTSGCRDCPTNQTTNLVHFTCRMYPTFPPLFPCHRLLQDYLELGKITYLLAPYRICNHMIKINSHTKWIVFTYVLFMCFIYVSFCYHHQCSILSRKEKPYSISSTLWCFHTA